MASKFKNAYAKVPKREASFTDLPIKSNDVLFGSPLTCNTDSIFVSLGDGCIGVIPATDFGRKYNSTSRIYASSNSIISLASTLLDSSIIASGCETEGVKIWSKQQVSSDNFNLHHTFDENKNKFRNLAFHPCTPQILSYSSGSGLYTVDLVKNTTPLTYTNLSNITSFSWKSDGSSIVCVNEIGEFHVFDPRSCSNALKFNISAKNVKTIWGGNSDFVMAFGSEKSSSSRFVSVWDIRNSSKIWSKKDIDTSIGMMFPVYDPDTGIIIISSKGSNLAYFLELESSGLSNIHTDKYDEACYGLYLAPRTSLNVMSCEVMKTYQLGKSSILPISYYVTRKSYSSYYPELFPDAYANEPSITADEWLDGNNKELNRVSLKPIDVKEEEDTIDTNNSTENCSENQESPSYRTPSYIMDTERYSKYRNIKGTAYHKKYQHKTLLYVDTKSPAESNGLAVYNDTVAIPLQGGTGKVGILKMSQPGRSSDKGMFFVENKSPLCDFDIDKKDDNLLACICDNTVISLWKLPPEGLSENKYNSDCRISGNTERPTIIKFHPCAKSILSTSTINGTVKIWDIDKASEVFSIPTSQGYQVLSMEWNQQGSLMATVCGNKKIYVIDPRSSNSQSLSSDGFQGNGPSRITFLDGNTLFLSGFLPNGNRIIGLRDIRKINDKVFNVELNSQPAVLIPYYDPDNKLIYLSAKGECSITPYEFRNDSTPLMELFRFVSLQPHSAVSMLRKDQCNIKEVEVAKFVRLMHTNTEIVSFVVPRVKSQYFQDDIFPPTLKVWESSMSSQEWLDKKDKLQGLLDLMPAGTEKVSEADFGPAGPKKYNSRAELERSKQQELKKTDNDFLGFVMGKAKQCSDDPVVQDLREGIDESEWDD